MTKTNVWNNLDMLLIRLRILDKTRLKIKNYEIFSWYIDLRETTKNILYKKINIPSVDFNVKLNRMIKQINRVILVYLAVGVVVSFLAQRIILVAKHNVIQQIDCIVSIDFAVSVCISALFKGICIDYQSKNSNKCKNENKEQHRSFFHFNNLK